MMLFDSHMHSLCSHDGKYTASEMAEASLQRGLNGICITDHFDAFAYDDNYDLKHIQDSILSAKKASEEYEGRIEVTSGIELGDFLYGEKISIKCLENFNFDFILCSVHSICTGRKLFENFEGLKTFSTMTPEEDNLFIKEYLDCTLKSLINSENDYDCLAHLTYPVRYITAVNKRDFDITKYYNQITEILRILIKKDKALEINTSCMNTGWKHTLPDYGIIKIYYDMGGRLITLGSDAHLTDRPGAGFKEVIARLRSIGFTEYYTYKKRKPIAISLC